MELTLALLLRVYGTLPDVVTDGLRSFRADLRRYMVRRTMATRRKGSIPGGRAFGGGWGAIHSPHHLLLDLNIRYSAKHAIRIGPPKASSTIRGTEGICRSEIAGRSYLHLNITAVAEMIAEPNTANGHKSAGAVVLVVGQLPREATWVNRQTSRIPLDRLRKSEGASILP